METKNKILIDFQSIKTKYMEGINIIRFLHVSDNTKLFDGLEKLISGYKVLEKLEKYIKNCDEVAIDERNDENLDEGMSDDRNVENLVHEEESDDNSSEEEFPDDIVDIKYDPLFSPSTMSKRKKDTNDKNSSHNSKRSKNECCGETIYVEHLHQWQALNERAMQEEPYLKQHIQSYESPEKWISDVIQA